ncbi:MAG: dihydrofolate reductase [Chitinophagaceae bacterium]|nr:dihydrofolate reductase [Chitinophagaceae bacterium]
MSKVIVSISMSLDGYIAGSNMSSKQPMGENGERIHDWMFKTKTDMDSDVIDEIWETAGAVIVGGRTYKVAISDAWRGSSPFNIPAFVITHSVPEEIVKGFTYITEGIEKVLMEATVQAGAKNIWVMGGADIIQQFINAKMVDELQINLVNVLMGKGVRLFDKINIGQVELEKQRVIDSTGVTHLKYRVIK